MSRDFRDTQPLMSENKHWGGQDPYAHPHGGKRRDQPLSKASINHRAYLGWGSAFFSCAALELAGVLGVYQRGLAFAAACQIVVLIFVLIMTNLFFSWKPADRHRQNWLLNIAFCFGIVFGLTGGQLGGYYFARWGNLSARLDYTKVSPDSSPLSFLNPGKMTFEPGTTLRGLQMGTAQFTSTNRLENRFRWYACATPIVGPKTTDTVNYWAITEGISPCTAPNACLAGGPCYGYVLTSDTDGHAGSAVEAAVREHGLKQMPGATYISLAAIPAEYTEVSLEKALGSTLLPFVMFPLFTYIIFYIICVYQDVGFAFLTGAQFPKYRHSQ